MTGTRNPYGLLKVCDPGHGWLRVPLQLCEGLDISGYSYVDTAKGVAWLEEDCDAPLFLRAYGVADASAIPVRVLNSSWKGHKVYDRYPEGDGL